MNKKQFAKWRQQCLDYLDKVKAKGRNTTHYTCPNCKKEIETVIPTPAMVDERGYSDGAKGCYECGEVSFVLTWPSGETEVVDMRELTPRTETK